MYGDISRWSFRPERHFSSVLFQQGRVTLDADANELTAILRHMQRTLTRDLIGPFGGPLGNAAFGVRWPEGGAGRELDDIWFTPGHYYVDGLLVEYMDTPAEAADLAWMTDPEDQDNPETLKPYASLSKQPFMIRGNTGVDLTPPFLLYLRVWERHVTAIEEPRLREIALGRTGPDTTTRTQIVWQVLVAREDELGAPPAGSPGDIRDYFLRNWSTLPIATRADARGRLRAQAKPGTPADSGPCLQSPESRFRGAENQLYRVEIHRTGAAGGDAAYTWSRDNATITFPVRKRDDTVFDVETLGRDDRRGLDVGDWVEVVDDSTVLGPSYDPDQPTLHQVKEIDPYERRVTLYDAPMNVVGNDLSLHPLLRRWDSQVARVPPAGGGPVWLDLEDGIQIQFEATPGEIYRRGDFWLIPARVETGDVFDWPRENGTAGQAERPRALPPAGFDDVFAPLAYVPEPLVDLPPVIDLRCVFPSMCQLVGMAPGNGM